MQIYSLNCGHGNVPRESELETVKIPAVISTRIFNGYARCKP